MRIGDLVEYVGESWLGRAMQETYPEGAIVIDVRNGTPVVRWPSGGWMIVGEPEALRVVKTMEERFATG